MFSQLPGAGLPGGHRWRQHWKQRRGRELQGGESGDHKGSFVLLGLLIPRQVVCWPLLVHCSLLLEY